MPVPKKRRIPRLAWRHLQRNKEAFMETLKEEKRIEVIDSKNGNYLFTAVRKESRITSLSYFSEDDS